MSEVASEVRANARGRERAASTTANDRGFLDWFGSFLANELKPYPGRLAVVWRMVLAATITMLLIMVFQIPGGANAAYNTLLISRTSTRATLASSASMFFWCAAAGLYSLLGLMLCISNPFLHFCWVLVSIAVVFFSIKKLPVTSAGPFASTIMVIIPVWDHAAPVSVLVEQTLWISGSVMVGLIVTILLEYIFSLFKTGDELTEGLTSRLNAFTKFLESYFTDQDHTSSDRIIHNLSILGVSRLRQLASTQGGSQEEEARRSTVISLVGRLIDISAAIIDAKAKFSVEDKELMLKMSQDVAMAEAHVNDQRAFSLPLYKSPAPASSPLLVELEQIVAMLWLTLSQEWDWTSAQRLPRSAANRPNVSALGSGNTGTLGFVLRGTLAASLCYVIINAIDWRGISTSMVTCAITALNSVGSSRQKQILRIAGAIVGGLIFGIGTQILIVPGLDTISGFAALFVSVTFIAAWFATSSPRLSYFGLQIALAFDIVHLQDFSAQANLATGRDRVVGIALGLAAMWFVFDTLGTASAARVMTETFSDNLDLLAAQATPWKDGKAADILHLRALREQISRNFAQVNSQADAVLFEVGPARQSSLVRRAYLLDLQPRLRSIFFVEIALLQYRIWMQPSEVDHAVFDAQQAFDEHASRMLKGLAQAIRSGRRQDGLEGMTLYQQRLQEAVEMQTKPHTARTDVLLMLFSRLSELLDGLQPLRTPASEPH